jgi:hypothetical protein
MEERQPRRDPSRLRWTLGTAMVVVAVFALVIALARPWLTPAPPTDEVIGVSFVLQQTRLPDGRSGMGFAPRVTVTKPAGDKRSAPGR